MNEKAIWSKILNSKVYVVIYNDPYVECECGMGIDREVVKGVATSEEQAEILIANLMKRVPYKREDFEIEEFNLDGELR